MVRLPWTGKKQAAEAEVEQARRALRESAATASHAFSLAEELERLRTQNHLSSRLIAALQGQEGQAR